MNRIASSRPRTRPLERKTFKDFTADTVTETKTVTPTVGVKVKTPNTETVPFNQGTETSSELVPPHVKPTLQNVTISGENKTPIKKKAESMSISVPLLFAIDWDSLTVVVNQNLTMLSKITVPPTQSYSYVKDPNSGADLIYYLTSFGIPRGDMLSNYSDGFNIEEGTDTKIYRIRGLYKIGYRFIKQNEDYIATSYFIELVSNVSKPDSYLSYSTYESTPFSYSGTSQVDIESEVNDIESFKLSLVFKNGPFTSEVKTLTWKCSILGGSNEIPCVDIPFSHEQKRGPTTISGIVRINKPARIIVPFETYLAYEAKDSMLNIYTVDSGFDNGGIYPMLSGKNKKILITNSGGLNNLNSGGLNNTLNSSITFPFRKCISFPINPGASSLTTLGSDTNFSLNFLSNQEGHYLGSNFNLFFELVKVDPNQVSAYVMDDTDKSIILNAFLFMRNVLKTGEVPFPVDSNIKWTTEKLADDASFAPDGRIFYKSGKTFKPVSGDMTKFFCRDNYLSFVGSNNIHLIKVCLSLSLPDN
jgi:hypothetical protein